MDKKAELTNKIADILELTSAETNQMTPLTNWDSLAVVSAMIAIDEVCGRSVLGQDLANCETVGDVLKLAGET